MANFTIAQLRAVGVQPATTDLMSTPGFINIEYVFDGNRQATTANDTLDIFEVPAYASLRVLAAGVSIVRAGTATGTTGINLGAAAGAGTAITGLTGWAHSTANVKLTKFASVAAAQDVTSTTTSNFVKLQCSTAAWGPVLMRVRIFGLYFEAHNSLV